MKVRFIYFLFIISVISACGKSVITAHPEMIGTWSGYSEGKIHTLIITSNNVATYSVSSGLLNYSKFSGTAAIKDDYLKIGLFKKYKINQYPTLTGNYYSVVLNNITLYN